MVFCCGFLHQPVGLSCAFLLYHGVSGRKGSWYVIRISTGSIGLRLFCVAARSEVQEWRTANCKGLFWVRVCSTSQYPGLETTTVYWLEHMGPGVIKGLGQLLDISPLLLIGTGGHALVTHPYCEASPQPWGHSDTFLSWAGLCGQRFLRRLNNVFKGMVWCSHRSESICA